MENGGWVIPSILECKLFEPGISGKAAVKNAGVHEFLLCDNRNSLCDDRIIPDMIPVTIREPILDEDRGQNIFLRSWISLLTSPARIFHRSLWRLFHQAVQTSAEPSIYGVIA